MTEIAISTPVEGPAWPSDDRAEDRLEERRQPPLGVEASTSPANSAPTASTTSGTCITGDASCAWPSYRRPPMNAWNNSRAMYQAESSAASDPST